ncbi:FtsX-like permease family protein [Microlunatus phosphovorus]|nr:FtsX-like permease family protein [Microlunatus phosphovorus]
MLRVTLSEVRAHPTRLLGIVLAVALSVGFVVASLVFVDTEAAAIRRAVSAQTAGSSVVVLPTTERDLTPTIAKTTGVEHVEASRNTALEATLGGRNTLLMVTTLPGDARLRWMTLHDGSWPRIADEIIIGRQTAERAKAVVGDTIGVRGIGGAGEDRQLRLTGLIDESASLFASMQSTAFAPASSPILADGGVEYLVIARPGVDPPTLASTLRTQLPADTDVVTSADLAQQRLEMVTGGVDVIRYLLLTFGSIAALVGSMIIANIFAIVVAQRRRQIGLLRAVGATRAQVRRNLLLEAAGAGVLGALLGALIGIGVAAVGAAATGSLSSGLEVRIGLVLLTGLAGVVITVLSALAPARRAMVVTPLDALRPVSEPGAARRAGRIRAVVGGALGLGGVAAIAAGLIRGGSGTLVLCIAGSALAAAAIIALAPLFLPPLLRGLARLLQRSRPTVRLASANLVRNPSRSAAVCTALMLGVGLIVTLQVGAASIKSSTEASLHHEFPVDVIVRSQSGALPNSVPREVRELPGIRAAITVPSAETQVGNGTVRLDGLGPDAGSVVAGGLDVLDDNTALVHPFTLEMIRKNPGDRVEIRIGGRSHSFVLRASDVADAGALAITSDALHKLAPDAPITAVWATAQPDADPAALMDDVRTIADRQTGLEVSGSLLDVAAISKVLDQLLAISTALTAVAVVIAVVGLGNALALSVIERSHESALLRALGLQRRQLRSMLAAEAILLALIGAAVGVLAGIGFGMVGTAAMAGEAGFAVTRFAISIPQTVIVLGAAVVAGAVASVLPGRRAARAHPVEALAQA